MESNEKLTGRVDELEDKYNAHETEIALMKQSQETMKDDIKAMRGNTSKLVWIVLAGVVGFLFNLLANGIFS